MEILSAGATGGREALLDEWRNGRYECARCGRLLYESSQKWKGPCVWPSFRRAVEPEAVSTSEVFGYNKYACRVFEIYCGSATCSLFIGHKFEDARAKGDTHPEARWRH